MPGSWGAAALLLTLTITTIMELTGCCWAFSWRKVGPAQQLHAEQQMPSHCQRFQMAQAITSTWKQDKHPPGNTSGKETQLHFPSLVVSEAPKAPLCSAKLLLVPCQPLHHPTKHPAFAGREGHKPCLESQGSIWLHERLTFSRGP